MGSIRGDGAQQNATQTLLSHWAAYHNHKETMAYAATALYLGGAVVALTTLDKLTMSSWVVVAGVAVVAGAVTGGFVGWQLERRAEAARRTAACVNRLVAMVALPEDFRVTEPRLGGSALLHYAVIIGAMLAVVVRSCIWGRG
jgi:hypothetical protein